VLGWGSDDEARYLRLSSKMAQTQILMIIHEPSSGRLDSPLAYEMFGLRHDL
jgi:hypothetical protein